MPTIDDLAPAVSASDTDEHIVSQAGVARKVTRAQILNGVQPQIIVDPQSLLGRFDTAIGGPQVIAIGSNLSFNGSTLMAADTPFVIDSLPAGTVPAGGDLVVLSQAGTNVAVTYSQFANGISGLSNIDLSQCLVTPVGSSGGRPLATLVSELLPLSGGSMAGSLLVSSPTNAPQAANKAYVDLQVSKSLPLLGGSLSGILTLASTPHGPLDAATKGYVDAAAGGMVSVTGGSFVGGLWLSADPAESLQASTKHYADLKVSRAGDTLNGLLTLASDPIAALHAATKNYVDTQVAGSLLTSGGTILGMLVLANDPIQSADAATKHYVDQRIMRCGDTLSGALVLASDPISAQEAATKNYVDVRASLVAPLSGASMTGPLMLAADPSAALQASTKQYVDLHVARTGDTLIGALYLAGNPTGALQAATKQYVDKQFSEAISQSGASFYGPVFLSSDPTSGLEASTKQYTDLKVSRSGDTLTGVLVLAADPTGPTQAATKHYVDLQMANALPLTGGTLTGPIVLGSGPLVGNEAATKDYVDSGIATAMPLKGGSISGYLLLGNQPTLPAHAADKQYVDSQFAVALPLAGGSLSGPLMLEGLPTQPSHAASKGYVDANPNSQRIINVCLPPYGAALNGVTDDTAAFLGAYIAAEPGAVIYVPNGTTVLQQPGLWGVALNKRVRWAVDGTLLADGTPLAAAITTSGIPADLILPGFTVGNTPMGFETSQGGSQANDFSVSHSSYIVNHSGGANGYVSGNVRNDTIIYNSPGNFIWGGIDRLLWVGIQTPTAATPAQHVGRYIQTIRQAAATGPTGLALPQPCLWSACLEYRDTTGQPSSAVNPSLTVEMDWFGNGYDDANSRQIQSIVVGQHNLSGAPVEVSTIIGVYLSGGSVGSCKTVLGVGIPFSNAVIDTSYATSINGAPIIKMSAGQTVAFEATNTFRLAFDASTNTLRWYQGSLSYPVGKGISVGWLAVYSASASIPNYIAGDIIFLAGSRNYAMTLPSASTVAPGIGFTFSVISSAIVSIVPNGTDTIDNGPITLQANDRYHIVSDGNSGWREVFRTNAVSPTWSAPPVLPSYSVASLPSGCAAGAQAFAANGRKPGEGSGSGSGINVFFDGKHWISSCTGAAATA